MQTRLRRLLEDYAEAHSEEHNVKLHYIGVPIIVFATLGLLQGWRGVPSLAESFGIYVAGDAGVLGLSLGAVLVANAPALILWAMSSLYYLSFNFRWGMELGALHLLLMLGAGFASPGLLWFGFIAGWLLQLIGHKFYEKRAPRFLQNFLHLMVAPLFIYAKLRGGWEPGVE